MKYALIVNELETGKRYELPYATLTDAKRWARHFTVYTAKGRIVQSLNKINTASLERLGEIPYFSGPTRIVAIKKNQESNS